MVLPGVDEVPPASSEGIVVYTASESRHTLLKRRDTPAGTRDTASVVVV